MPVLPEKRGAGGGRKVVRELYGFDVMAAKTLKVYSDAMR